MASQIDDEVRSELWNDVFRMLDATDEEKRTEIRDSIEKIKGFIRPRISTTEAPGISKARRAYKDFLNHAQGLANTAEILISALQQGFLAATDHITITEQDRKNEDVALKPVFERLRSARCAATAANEQLHGLTDPESNWFLDRHPGVETIAGYAFGLKRRQVGNACLNLLQKHNPAKLLPANLPASKVALSELTELVWNLIMDERDCSFDYVSKKLIEEWSETLK